MILPAPAIIHQNLPARSQKIHKCCINYCIYKRKEGIPLNNWLKIGLPIVIAILLVISAVAITLAVTSGNPSKQVVSAAYTTQGTSETQLARGGNCPNCTVNNSGDANQPGYGNGTGSSCCSTGTTDVYVPQTNSGRGCCSGR